VFQSGEIKVRGIELRRHDTPDFIKELQQQMLDIPGQGSGRRTGSRPAPGSAGAGPSPAGRLKRGRVPPEKLIVHQTLSRELEAYRSPSPTALAARQLAEYDKDLRPGQVVRFVYTLGKPGVRAWDVPGELDQQDYRHCPLFHSAGARSRDYIPTFPIR